jgi:coatomer subunit beta
VVERFPHLRQTICEKIRQTLGEIKSGKVFRGVLWILGEYIETVADIQSSMQEIRKVLGEIPILASEQRLLDEAGGAEDGEAEEGGKEKEKEKEKEKGKAELGGGKPRVLADGTYATETAFTSTTAARLEAVKAASKPPLRSEFLSRCDNISFAKAVSFFSIDFGWRFLHRRCLGFDHDKISLTVRKSN